MKKIAIVVGHTPNGGGATNADAGETEFTFNNELASMLAAELRTLGMLPIIVYRETYSLLPEHVNETKADLCLSLHCNAFNGTVSGCEVLHYHKSDNGERLALALSEAMSAVLDNPNRGAKAIDYDYTGQNNDKGGWLVEKTSMPCVILEPFFIDNNQELSNATSKKSALVECIADVVSDYLIQ